MWVNWIPFFIMAAVLECIGQILFKKAASAHRETGGMQYYFKLAADKRAVGGILTYAVEMILWIYLLSQIPLSIAFPLSGLQQLFIILASFFILNERISNSEWLGAGLIVMGISIIVKT